MVISSPDSDAVRCLQLSDGVLLWKAELGEEDLYVGAVTPEKVLVVGRHGCRALSLANGKTVWEHSTPRPSGQGTLCRGPGGDMVYYLPLQSGDVLALNLDKPAESVQQHRHGSAALGNLVLQDGRPVVADGHGRDRLSTAAAAARQGRGATESQPARSGLAPRARPLPHGPRRLGPGRGRPAQARRLLPVPPSAAAGVALRDRLGQELFDALTEFLRRDFAAGEARLEEYRSLCSVAIPEGTSAEARAKLRQEERRRQVRRLILLAQGREGQGRAHDALNLYRELLDQADAGELLSFPDVPGVKLRADIWARNRVEAMLRRSAGDTRDRLRQQIDRDWRAASTPAALERCLALFEGVPGTSWPELLAARTALVERWSQTRDRRQALPILLRLLDVEEHGETPGLRARALQARANVLTALGLAQDAAECYRRLRRDFAREQLAGGLTGSEVFDDAGTDKRLLGSLEPPPPIWQGRGFRAVQSKSGTPVPMLVCSDLLPRYGDGYGEPDPVLSVQGEHRPALSLRGLHFRWRQTDRNWSPSAGRREPFAGAWRCRLPWRCGTGGPTVDCCVIDHLAVITLGTTLLAVDLIERRVCWKRNIFDESLPGQVVRPGMDGTVTVFGPSGQYVQRWGLVGPLGRGGLYVQSPSGLLALDLITGQPALAAHGCS